MADDWSPAKIKYKLNELGLSLTDVERQHALKPKTCASAAKKPHEAGEKAIADTLGVTPKDIWPSRYRPSGQRLRPQPKNNYRPEPVYRHRLIHKVDAEKKYV